MKKVEGDFRRQSVRSDSGSGRSETELERQLRQVDDALNMSLRERRLAWSSDGELPEAVAELMAKRIELEDALRVVRGELPSVERSPVVDELTRRASKLDAATKKLAPLVREFDREYVALARLRTNPVVNALALVRYDATTGSRRQLLAEVLLEAVELIDDLKREGVDLRSVQHDFFERAARSSTDLPRTRMRGIPFAAGVGAVLGAAFSVMGAPAAVGVLIGMGVIVLSDLERTVYFDDSQLRLALRALDELKAQRTQGIGELALALEKEKQTTDDVSHVRYDDFDLDVPGPRTRASDA